MANNIGVTSRKLPRVIGQTSLFDTISELSSITLITGELDLGCLVFDVDGTMGICSAFERDADNNPLYTIQTVTLSAEIDVSKILSGNY